MFLWVCSPKAVSARGFTVLGGAVIKSLNVVINLAFWDKHSTRVGTLGLLICMLGGVTYQQSPTNKPRAVNETEVQESDEELQKILKKGRTKRKSTIKNKDRPLHHQSP